MVENTQLKEAMMEYEKLLEELRGKIVHLTTNMEENECKIALHTSEERKKEKEFFLKIIKDYETQRGDNLQDLEQKCIENSTLSAQLEKKQEELDTLKKRNETLTSQVSSMQVVVQEQIKKKKEMLQDNKEMKSRLTLLETRVEKATIEIEKAKSAQSIVEKNAEIKDLTTKIKELENSQVALEKERETLKKENVFLKLNLESMTASTGADHTDLKILNENDLEEHKNNEIIEIQDLQTMISNSISDLKFPSESTEKLFEVENTFKDLKTCEQKLRTATESLQTYKKKLQSIENSFCEEKNKLMVKAYTKEKENKLLKMQIEKMAEGSGGLGAVPDRSKMWAVLKKSKRLHEISQMQNK